MHAHAHEVKCALSDAVQSRRKEEKGGRTCDRETRRRTRERSETRGRICGLRLLASLSSCPCDRRRRRLFLPLLLPLLLLLPPLLMPVTRSSLCLRQGMAVILPSNHLDSAAAPALSPLLLLLLFTLSCLCRPREREERRKKKNN